MLLDSQLFAKRIYIYLFVLFLGILGCYLCFCFDLGNINAGQLLALGSCLCFCLSDHLFCALGSTGGGSGCQFRIQLLSVLQRVVGRMQILCSLIELVISIRNQIWTNKCKQYQENDHTKSNHRNHILLQTAPCILPIRNALTFLDEILFLGLGGTVEIICTVIVPVQKLFNIRL